MSEREIYEKIVENVANGAGRLGGLPCSGVHCYICPFNYPHRGCQLRSLGGVEYCKQKLKEMDMNVPELVGVEMLVSFKGEAGSKKRFVFGRLGDGYLVTASGLNGDKISADDYNECKPIPETLEVTMSEVCEKFGCNVKIKKGNR